MARLSAKLRSVTGGIAYWCPGCDRAHVVITHRDGEGPCWDWNGDVEKPTLNPSVRHFNAAGTTCHYFVKEGNIEFCTDSLHSLAGKTVPLPDWPFVEGAYGGV